MENTLNRQEHNEFHGEFAHRIDAENKRQNRRIALLEENMQKINALVVSVEKITVNMENMLEELKKQGEKIEKLEEEPVETGKQIKIAIITSVAGTVVGAVVTAVLMLI